MTKSFLALCGVVSLSAALAESVPQDLHLFLLGGQSNMSGRGTLTATNRVDHARVYVMTPAGGWRPATEPFHWEKPKANAAGLAASFARAYADAHPGVSVGLVPVAYGGSSIRNWQPGKVHYTNAVAYARQAMAQGTFKGFLWHQGESDAFEMAHVRGYVPLFTNAIIRLRQELGLESVPFVAGELGPYLKDWQDPKRPNLYWQEMNAEIAKGVKLLPRAVVVPSEGLYDVRKDRIHFETPSLRRFGLRYFESYRTCLPPLEIAEIRKLGAVGAQKPDEHVPEGLLLTREEQERLAARQRAEAAEIGYVPRVTPFKAGHSFAGFVSRCWNTDRSFLGLTPSGVRGVELEGAPAWIRGASKMCVSNEDVVDAKIADWVKAGKPECLKCGENDGLLGYCRCEKCRALDADLPGERFIHHKSDRYVDFWNRIAEKARAIRPDVKVTVHLYSVLRHPPRRAKIKYPDNMMCSYVPSLHDADPAADIRAWKAAGLKNFFTRPNWLCTRSVLPLGLERRIYDLHRALFAEGSKGMDEDPTPGNPAIGFEICMLEHLCADPNVPFEKIEDYWYGRFGAAKDVVRAYYEGVRARCDREWPKLLARLRDRDVEFLDDGHFCRVVHELHTVAELEADLAVLESFDAAALEGDAAVRFAELKTNARHYILARRALETKSPADKQALTEFRIANRAVLGNHWRLVYTKGEVDLWWPERNAYMDLGIESYVEKIEERERISRQKFALPEISRLPGTGCPPGKSTLAPPELNLTADEAKVIAERQKRDFEESGAVDRRPYHSGHYTSRLLKRFWDTRRDFFGLLPNGERGVDLPDWPPFFRATTKLCVSNEDAVDQKIADWVADGKPQLFVAGEDDGLLGYCRCEKCRALDADLPGERFVHHKTDRYINFWNRLTAKAVALRPDVMVTVFAYSVLRHPPRHEKIAYPDNMRFSFIPTFHDTDKMGMVAAWKKAGMKHFYLRPNYLCARNHMPYGIEEMIYDEVHAFLDAGASGFQFDGARSFPSNAFEIYVIERLSADPNVSFARIERDWCARFGAAAGTVQAYYRRVRARCNREWPRLVQWLRENDLEFLDDGHVCLYVYRLHTAGEFEDDLNLLETFRGELTGEAARRFDDLKTNVRHQLLVKRAMDTKSAADKQALTAFRLANRTALGWGFGLVYKKGEVELWYPGTKHEAYMRFGEEAFVEKFENAMKSKVK